MNLELILWIVAYIISSEILYVIWLFKSKKDDYGLFDDWLSKKLLSFLIMLIVFMIQLLVVFGFFGDFPFGIVTGNYINLLWELLVIVGIIIFFAINKWISEKVKSN